MSIDSRTQTVDATGQIRLANANFLFIIASTAALVATLSRGGSTESFQAITTGLRIARVVKWEWAFLTAAPGTIITYFYGITAVREDATDLQQALATISGTVNIAEVPSATVADTADTAQASATQTAVSANLARRRYTIGVRSDSANTLRVSQAGGAGRGLEVGAGQTQEWRTTSALVLRNDNTLGGAGSLTWCAEEES